jgi:hypothetical protein
MPAAFPVIIHGGADHVLLRSFRHDGVLLLDGNEWEKGQHCARSGLEWT